MAALGRRIWRRFYAPASPIQKAIARLDLPEWRVGPEPANGIFLVDGTIPSSSYILRAAMMARAYAKVKGLIPLVFCENSSSLGNPWKGIYQALGMRHFLGFQRDRLNPWRIAVTAVRAWRLWRSIDGPEALLAASYRGIAIGDLVYDDVLRTGERYTIDRIGWWLFKHLFRAVRTYEYFSRLLDRYPIKAATLSHSCYSLYGIAFRLLLKRGIPVINDVRKFTSLDQYPFVSTMPSPALLEQIASVAPDTLKLVDRELELRFSETSFTADLGTLYAYKGRRRITPLRLREELGIDDGLPIVTIMAHCFADACHCLGWMIYKDTYDWLVDTLRYANAIAGVHWLLKPHPAASLYGEDGVVSQLFKDENLTNIKLLKEQYHALSVAEASHALVTCFGTCGAEYAHLGVPTILAGQNAYSHCGFTYNAKSKGDYYDLLTNVASLAGLSAQQMEKARLYNFFRLVMMRSIFSNLFPETDENVFGDERGRRTNRMLQEMYQKIQSCSLEDDGYYRRVVAVIESDREYLPEMPGEVGSKADDLAVDASRR